MNCLHICNDFFGSKVHRNLYQALSQYDIRQTIFYPSRIHMTDVIMDSDVFDKGDLLISKPIKKYHRILFRRKIDFLYKDLRNKVDISFYDITHATTLFSDGAISLRIKKDFGIPYIVAVRATDIDGFLKLRPDLYRLAHEILCNAERIIFISPSLKSRFFMHRFIMKRALLYENKAMVIYNGIDPLWLQYRVSRKDINPFKILYVGTFIKRKNALNLAHAVLALNMKGETCNVTFVGSGGSLEEPVKLLAEKNPGLINCLGSVHDFERLREIYLSHHIFALPSKGETFGLVYLEALSQGLPILYVPNEGIDGIFNEPIGEKCADLSVGSISDSLSKMLKNYADYPIDNLNLESFSWSAVGKAYFDIYRSVLN